MNFLHSSVHPKMKPKQDILNWIIQILHYFCRKQHKNIENPDFWTKCCYLSFSALLSAYCAFWFLHLPQRQGFFSSWTHFKQHKWSFVLYIVLFSGLKMAFSKLNLAKYYCLHKKLFIVTSVYFISCLQLLQNIFTYLSLL